MTNTKEVCVYRQQEVKPDADDDSQIADRTVMFALILALTDALFHFHLLL